MKFALLTTAVAFFGAAAAAPFLRNEPNVVQRDVTVLGVRSIPRDIGGLPSPQSIQLAKDKRDGDKITPKIINREPAPQDIPAEEAVKSDGGPVVPYPKRETPAEPYVKRQDDVIPAEIAVKSDGNGGVIPYVKRQDDVIPAEIAVKSDGNGGVIPYVKRQDDVIPAEIAVKSDGNGGVIPYVKRQDNVIPAEVAVKSDGNGIIPY